jgi:hypothetical protein
MVRNTLKHWETGIVDMTSASVPNLITTLRGGESVTIKAIGTSAKFVYIGANKLVSATTGYRLLVGETVTFSLPITFGVNNFIEIWGLTTNAGDDVCYFKLIGLYPSTEASV